MRPEYIEAIKDYLKENPHYSQNLEDVRKQSHLLGATEAEFDEALIQFGKTKKAEEKQFPKQAGSNRLMKLDFAAHVTVIILLSAIIGFYVSWPLIGGVWENESQPAQIQKQTTHDVIQKAYARSEPLDAKKIFSYPSSNVSLSVTGIPSREVYGFFPYWMLSASDQINLNGLTTIGLFGLETDGNGNIVIAHDDGSPDKGWEMWTDPQLDTLITRAKARRINIELVIKSFNNNSINNLALSESAQTQFIANAIQLMNLKQLNGINLDFEYIGEVDPKVRDGFTRLVTNLRTEMKRNLPNSTLTVDTYALSASEKQLFDIPALTDQIDAFIVMGYDFHTPLGESGPIAPMEGAISIIGSVQSFLEKVPAEKVILAVPYYGYDWPVPNNYGGIGSKTVSYAEIANLSKSHSIQWDENSQTPFIEYTDPETSITRQIHYENPRSLGVKYDYVNRKNLRGVGIWALGYDGLNGDLRQVLMEKFSQ